MRNRHARRPGTWESVAVRLDEIIGAHSGEDAFEEALALLVAKLAHEMIEHGAPSTFLASADPDAVGAERDRLLRLAGDAWPGLLAPDNVAHLGGAGLVRAADVLRPVSLVGDNLVGLDAIFEFIVNKAAKGQKGQYFTPRFAIDAIVDMVRPVAGECIADPACGSGGFLRHALVRAPGCAAWGFDHDARAARVARVMMAASGQPTSRVVRCDSLQRPGAQGDGGPVIEQVVRGQQPDFAGFDMVLTNPPFAGDVGRGYADTYELARDRRVERDVLFIERCVALLRPGGRLAMVLPYNKLGGIQWAFMRRWLLARVRVVAVIALGRNTFQPHTGQKACVLLGIKRAQPVTQFADDDVLFYLSERDGKDSRGRLVLAADGHAVDHDLSDAVPLVQAAFDRVRQAG